MLNHTTSHHLRRLQALRWMEIAGQILILGIASYGFDIALPLLPVMTVILALTALTLLIGFRLQGGRPVTEFELCAQLLVDVAALFLLLYFTGGATNPFVSLFLLPLSVSAALLSARYAWFVTAITLGCYTVLLYYYQPLPGMAHHMPMLTLMGEGMPSLYVHGEDDSFSWHILGMWLNFVISAGLITFFVQRIAGSLRSRERELAEAREATLRNERIVALGMLAASTAHELGTPLATVAIVAKELEHAYANDPELAPQLGLIGNQIAQCKQVLQRVVSSTADMRGETITPVQVADYVHGLAERWHLLWPQTPLELRWKTAVGIRVGVDSTLEQAMLSLLNNAARVSPAGIVLEVDAQAGQLVLRILDQGPGPAPALMQAAGKTLLPGHSEEGLGIGLYLANASIERLGGSVQLTRRSEGGGRTEVRLPVVTAHD